MIHNLLAFVENATMINQLEQSLQKFKLDRVTQLATAENNKIISTNQLADAQNSVIQFGTTSAGSLRDLEAQIAQTNNDILSAQADLSSAQRSSTIQTSGKVLEINTLSNQLRLAEKSLNDNKVTNAGLVHLKGLTKLGILGLRNTKVSDAGLEHLKGLTSLFKLLLLKTKVTDEGVKGMQAALPNCEIEYTDKDGVERTLPPVTSSPALQQ